MSTYVCRVHVAEAVSWRGTGCRQCDTEAAATRDEHAETPDDLAPAQRPEQWTATP